MNTAVLHGPRTVQSDLQVASRLLRASWPVFLIFAVLGALGAAAFLHYAPSVYEADAILLVDPQNATGDGAAPNGATPELVRSQVEVVQSQTVLSAVVTRLKLYNDPEFATGSVPV